MKKNKVHFTGFVDPLILPKYLAAADLYIHPARVEPHSLAISEAIHMGCPVIISDRCGSYGADDDVQEGKNGFVYNFGDIDQLTAIVKKVVSDKSILEKFSKYSRKISLEFQDRAHKECLNDLIKAIAVK